MKLVELFEDDEAKLAAIDRTSIKDFMRLLGKRKGRTWLQHSAATQLETEIMDVLADHPGRRLSLRQLADQLETSRNSIKVTVHRMRQKGYPIETDGKNGGYYLSKYHQKPEYLPDLNRQPLTEPSQFWNDRYHRNRAAE